MKHHYCVLLGYAQRLFYGYFLFRVTFLIIDILIVNNVICSASGMRNEFPHVRQKCAFRVWGFYLQCPENHSYSV